MLNCASCGAATRVLETRGDQQSITRRRECLNCKQRVTTLELPKWQVNSYQQKPRAAVTPTVRKPKVNKPTSNNAAGLKNKAIARKRLEELQDMKEIMDDDSYSLSADELRKEMGW